MTVKEIVKAYLDASEYDGLYSKKGECACLKDDLEPCYDGMRSDCAAGYRVDYPDRHCPCGEGCDWHIHGDKPALAGGDAEGGEG